MRDLTAARFLLRRTPLEAASLPPSVSRRISEVFGEDLTAGAAVDLIIDSVRTGGDAALLTLADKIDGISLTHLEVSKDEISQARKRVSGDLVNALKLAAKRVRSFHHKQKRHAATSFSSAGLGQVVRPLERVGIYVPGGTSSYPSTVLMTAIPARVAGVQDIVMCTPPNKEGAVPAITLAAADIAGVDRVFMVGGAQAIAAMAFGTTTIPKVDKICGPGNIFVTLAKKKVYGTVDIDGLQGPTETVVVADETANPALCAADLLAQAEHDPMSSAILITCSDAVAEAVSSEVDRQLALLERNRIASESISKNGAIIVTETVDQALELANLYAPEHLCLLLKDAASHVPKVRNAGGIFVGEVSPEALGDYVAGPSHVMPTSGTARFSSPLGVHHFLKVSSLVALTEADLKALGPSAAALARAEGLTAHARAVEQRLERLL
ncbi:MAG: histidinol dehydrogenase [Dehalococcoidia bacterium]|nr:histidinol dehydrogenase [Dehalococcoidia bacterium]